MIFWTPWNRTIRCSISWTGSSMVQRKDHGLQQRTFWTTCSLMTFTKNIQTDLLLIPGGTWGGLTLAATCGWICHISSCHEQRAPSSVLTAMFSLHVSDYFLFIDFILTMTVMLQSLANISCGSEPLFHDSLSCFSSLPCFSVISLALFTLYFVCVWPSAYFWILSLDSALGFY